MVPDGRWTTEQTTELLNLISRNDGWRFCIFGKGYKTSFKYEATRQLCLAMFAKDKGWLQSMVKAGLSMDDDGVCRATEASDDECEGYCSDSA